MLRPTLRLLLGVSALALIGTRLPDASAGTVSPATPRRRSAPSLLAHSRHRFYYDRKVLQARISAQTDGLTFSADLEDFLSTHEALVSAGFADGAFHSAYRFNLRTGRVLPDKWVTHQIRDSSYLKPREWELSPDGKWILWKNGWLTHNYAIAATPVKPTRQHPRSLWWNLHSDVPVQEAEIAWFTNSHRWMEFWSPDRDLPTEAHIYDLDKPGYTKRISIAPAHTGRRLAGIAPDGTVVTTTDRNAGGIDEPPSEVAVTTFHLDAPRQTRRRVVVHAPAGGFVQGLRLSPDGRMIAWLMVSGKNHDTLTVGTTDETGAHWREIGEITRPSAGEMSGGYLAGWLPDSKSFLVGLSAADPKRGRDDLRQISVR